MPASSSPIREMSATFAKCSSTSFSASAQEFVPSGFYPASATPAYNPYAMTENYQYNPYSMAQSQAHQYPSYTNPAQGMTNHAPAGSCLAICLDDYSDFSDVSDDDSESEKPSPKSSPLALVVTKVAAGESPNKSSQMSEDEECRTPTTKSPCDTPSMAPTTPNPSICEPESDAYYLSDASDKEPEDEPEVGQVGNDASFSVDALLKLRHSIPWDNGFEERSLDAMEVAPSELPQPDHAAEKPQRRPPTSKPQRSTRNRGDAAKKGPEGRKPTRTTRPQDKKCPFDNFKRDCSSSEELPVSDSSWLAQQQARRRTDSTDDEAVSDETVVRSMKSILNKLTVEKFGALYEKLISCGITTTKHLEALIHEIFTKATTQHHFINMYAELCAHLHNHFVDHPISDDPKATFKKLLLNACQAFFEKHVKPPAELEKLDEEERVTVERKYKMQMLGNIKFVGALLVRQMLASKILFAIVEELLSEPTPESLESLAALLTVVGPTFDVAECPCRPLLEEIFKRVMVLTKQSAVNCRVRFLLKDVLELRASRWHDKKAKKVEGPSTLKQVADTQAKEASASTSTQASRRPQGKDAPRRPQGKDAPRRDAPSGDKGGKRMASLASSLFTRDGASPKSTTPQEGYRRINSLAALKLNRSTDAGAQATKPQEKPEAKSFDKEFCRKEVSGALAELRLSHELKEALMRIVAVRVPVSQQPEELCDMLSHMSEEGSEAVRKVYFELVVALFKEGHWKPDSLANGLQHFAEDVCPDLKCDVPTLPCIVHEELYPALAPLAEKGLLQASQLEILKADW